MPHLVLFDLFYFSWMDARLLTFCGKRGNDPTRSSNLLWSSVDKSSKFYYPFFYARKEKRHKSDTILFLGGGLRVWGDGLVTLDICRILKSIFLSFHCCCQGIKVCNLLTFNFHSLSSRIFDKCSQIPPFNFNAFCLHLSIWRLSNGPCVTSIVEI